MRPERGTAGVNCGGAVMGLKPHAEEGRNAPPSLILSKPSLILRKRAVSKDEAFPVALEESIETQPLAAPQVEGFGDLSQASS